MEIQADRHGRSIGWEIVAQKLFNLQALPDAKASLRKAQ
jgi:hypothetical protein